MPVTFAGMDQPDFPTISTPESGYPSQPFGDVASRYALLGEVGRGGMGVVYRGRHNTLDRQVAIKITLPGAPQERFLREARLLARINSPHVVIVHDFDILPDGSPMLVMEWVEGKTLLDVLTEKGGCLPEDQALAWMRQTSHGMLAAAEQGIIHRDLKPSNILVDDQGKARVADFGLARGPQNPDDLALSLQGMMGTPYYMAPEQAEDPRGVDTRADIYSFGATFYHALTGEPPFKGETVFSILFKHKTEPLISPVAKNPILQPRTSELLERCLAKNPNDRFQSFAEVLGLLEPARSAASPWDASDDARLTPYLARYQSRREIYLNRRDLLPEPDVFDFPGGRTLQVLCGNIVQQQVHALVSSDDEDLTMGGPYEHVRGVAKALLLAAGPQLLEEAKRYVPVRPGRAVVTSAGNLPARYVFHGVTLGASRDPSVRPSRDLISEIMTSCFYQADSLYVQSIAFPLLGTGTGRFSEDVCLDTMFRFLARTLLHGLTCVREARIVLFAHSSTSRIGGCS
jgi:serine/threonine protein kinase